MSIVAIPTAALAASGAFTSATTAPAVSGINSSAGAGATGVVGVNNGGGLNTRYGVRGAATGPAGIGVNGSGAKYGVFSNGPLGVATGKPLSCGGCVGPSALSSAAKTISFTALTLQNGWTNAPFSTRNAAVGSFGGIVYFKGAIASGASSSAFTLPASFRPATYVYLPVDMCNATKGRLIIAPTGVVTVQAESSFSNAQCFTSLEGASFAR
ncbi:MAG TPA: hypothetical protein VL403_17740 [Candidatus Kryptonia bacterium]|nr:hypothetical protein [Candidatus Kryptonia bacterium]